ncbi:uncharacterized protein B0P05DRAFT_527840 [Gilbertella persicaria]|uniref:uncharacterized protein n=1 Tax=Gilbertella persicaria TaxID=101096 RepID=UPI00221FB46A|nr:uncharacterized protein B0P05DRAFT_527840 [Gilbertella persicaria]KAI8090892.1 hypothetical protein B0P05DRAFT_527840 [Gilbertella persicaria]
MSNKFINDIQSISYSKLAEYDQTRIDLPIRKYVLITNLLRDPSSPPAIMSNMEQHWFDACINQLDKEEQEQEEENQQEQEPVNTTEPDKNKQYTNNNIHLHAFYHLHHGNGFLVCASKI